MTFCARGCSAWIVLDAWGPWTTPHLSPQVGLVPWIKLIKIKLTVASLSRRVAFLQCQEHAQFLLALGPSHTHLPLLGVLPSMPSLHRLVFCGRKNNGPQRCPCPNP